MTPNRSETDNEGNTKYFYSAEEIRKWLMEPCTIAMIQSASPDMDMDILYSRMIAAKLEELK